MASALYSAAARVHGRLAELLRYATVSAIATVVGLSVLAVLVGVAHMAAGWSNVVATAVGTLPSFELNRRWVWRRSDRSLLTQALPFVALAFVELIVSTAAVHAAGAWADRQGLADLMRVVVVLAANVAAFGSLWVAQFVLCDRLLFRPPAIPAGTGSEVDEEAVCR